MSAQPPFPPISSEGDNEINDAPTIPGTIRLPESVLPPPSPSVDLYAQTQISQSPMPPVWPPASAIDQGQQPVGAPPPPPAPRDAGIPPAPGPMGTPPKKRHTSLLVALSVVLLVVIVGAVVAFVFLRPGSTASTPTCALSGYTAFTSPDQSFCLVYPTGWQVTNPVKGTGAAFSGPVHQVFTVANIGAVSSTPTDFDIAFCNNLGGRITQMTTVTLSGQTWTQAHCSFNIGTARAVVEAVIYKGKLYHMDYGSPAASFQSDQSQTFTPMEQSFRFLA